MSTYIVTIDDQHSVSATQLLTSILADILNIHHRPDGSICVTEAPWTHEITATHIHTGTIVRKLQRT